MQRAMQSLDVRICLLLGPDHPRVLIRTATKDAGPGSLSRSSTKARYAQSAGRNRSLPLQASLPMFIPERVLAQRRARPHRRPHPPYTHPREPEAQHTTPRAQHTAMGACHARTMPSQSGGRPPPVRARLGARGTALRPARLVLCLCCFAKPPSDGSTESFYRAARFLAMPGSNRFSRSWLRAAAARNGARGPPQEYRGTSLIRNTPP